MIKSATYIKSLIESCLLHSISIYLQTHIYVKQTFYFRQMKSNKNKLKHYNYNSALYISKKSASHKLYIYSYRKQKKSIIDLM